MKKTKLMELAESYGDRGAGSLRSSTIDGVVYQISELAEAAFGAEMIEALWEDIALTEANFPKKKSLQFIVSRFLHKNLATALAGIDKDKVSSELLGLPPLNEKSYVDYYVALTTLERHTFKTSLETACGNVPTILSGYSTETSYPVCEGIIKFFQATKDEMGCFHLIQALCEHIKESSQIS